MSKYKVVINLEDENNSHTKIIKLTGFNKRVLDFGCASGEVSKVLQERGCQVIGIELDPEDAEKAKKYCERVIVADIDQMSLSEELGSEKFQVAIFGDILEHLKCPEKILIETREFLTKDGYVVASIPNVAHSSVRLQLLAGNFDYQDLGILDKTHLRFYNKKSVVHFFERCGYIIDTIDRVVVETLPDDFKFLPPGLKSQVIEFLNRDPESKVNQYIIKAFPAKEPNRIIQLLETIDSLEKEKDKLITQMKERLKEKEEQIKQRDELIAHLANFEKKVKNTLIYKAYRAIKNLVR